jgi:uncharacterized protein YndB with AHSA1/START domain
MSDGVYRVTEKGEHEVRFDRLIDQPVAKVWAALTDPAVLKNWMGDITVEPRVGGKYVIDFRGAELMTGTITAFEPQRMLAYTWIEDGKLPPSQVRWELSRDGDGCRLVLTHTYPASMTRKQIIPFLGGWHAFMDVIGRGAAGQFIPYQDESGLRAHYATKYLEAADG